MPTYPPFGIVLNKLILIHFLARLRMNQLFGQILFNKTYLKLFSCCHKFTIWNCHNWNFKLRFILGRIKQFSEYIPECIHDTKCHHMKCFVPLCQQVNTTQSKGGKVDKQQQ